MVSQKAYFDRQPHLPADKKIDFKLKDIVKNIEKKVCILQYSTICYERKFLFITSFKG